MPFKWLSLVILLCCYSTAALKADTQSEQAKPESLTAEELTKMGLDTWYLGDFVTAMGYLKQADEKGDIKGTVALAKLYHFSSEFDAAVELLEKARKAGEPEGTLMLVEYYQYGNGVREKQPEKARLLLEELVAADYQPAKLRQAIEIESGRLGYTQDLHMAFEICLKLAESGFAPAMQVVHEAYKNGRMGQTINEELATQWFQRITNTIKSDKISVGDY